MPWNWPSPVHKLIVAHPDSDFDGLLHDVTTIAGDRAEVTHSSREFIEVSARGVDKAFGVRVLAGAPRHRARDTVAIGDMPNELPMLAWGVRRSATESGVSPAGRTAPARLWRRSILLGSLRDR